MRRVLFLALAALLCAGSAAAQKQTATTAPAGPSVINRSGAPVDVERIIRTFTQKETEFRGQASPNPRFGDELRYDPPLLSRVLRVWGG